MKDPKRLREEQSDRLTVLLLEAGRDEAPSNEWLGRLLGGAAAAGTTMAATAAAAGTAAPLASSALPFAIVVKWLGIGALAGVVASAGAGAVLPEQRENASKQAAPREQSPAVAVTAPVWGGRVAAGVPEPLGPVTQKQSAPVALVPVDPPAALAPQVPVAPMLAPPRSARAHEAVAPSEKEATATLPAPATASSVEAAAERSALAETRAVREEVRALGLAKAALNRGSPAETLSVLAEYRARFPQGRLRPEAAYLEMEAELARGNRERARALAQRLSVGPLPNAERARAILKEEER